MKKRIVLTIALVALLPLAAFPQTPSSAVPAQAPVPPVPPAPASSPAPPSPAVHSMEHEQAFTYLGVETSRVPRVLSEQMNLPRGFGVVIDYVAPKSPAAAAGVEQNDILRMLNDQLIVDSEQLGVLVRSFPDGANVSLTIVRKGKEMKLTATLHQRKEAAWSGRDFDWKIKRVDQLRDLDQFRDFHLPDMTAVNEAVARAKAEALRAGAQAREAARRFRIITTDGDTTKTTHVDLGNAQIVLSDSKGELRLENNHGRKMLTVKDPQGKVQFSGPIDTTEERAKLPPEVRTRLESLEHQELPPVPPNEPIAPQNPLPNESVRSAESQLQQTCLAPANPRTGWRRETLLL